MLVHHARDQSTRVLDHFVAVPGLGLRRPGAHAMEAVGIDFTPESSQFFRIGPASCAVPGATAGLGEAHRRFATLPWRTLLEPAIAHAREGVVLLEPQAYLHALLDPILRHTDEGRAMYSLNGNHLVAGDRLVLDDLGRTLEQLAEKGPNDLYTGELARELSKYIRDGGGDITLRDLRLYRVIQRRPVRVPFLGYEFHSNPPPSRGGVLIGLGLQLLDRMGVAAPPGSAEAMAQLVEIMREQEDAAVDGRFSRELYRGGLARRLADPRHLAAAARRIRRQLPELKRGTTHISVVDAQGNAASLTASTGAGSGVIVPGTGIQLNNMLGEFDLTAPRPGVRFTSGMAPSLVIADGRPRLVVGSAGSLRLRGAILQIVVNTVAHGLGIEEALARPRVHLEEGKVHVEGGNDPAEVARLESRGYDLLRWRDRNLFFGGAAGVELLDDGALAAAGDPRRGGHGVVVA